jgi:hypothetical protein
MESKKPKSLIPLPEVAATYFAAANARNVEAACACFASDALVHDEGRDQAGTSAIREWIEETARKYDPQFEPCRAEERGKKTVVHCIVSGNFPRSPVELEFEFTTLDGKISRLTIG